MSIDPLDRPHDNQPVPGQDQNPSHTPERDFVTDNPDVILDVPGEGGKPADQPASGTSPKRERDDQLSSI